MPELCHFTPQNLSKLRNALAITMPKKRGESACEFIVRCIDCPPLWKRVGGVISSYLGAGVYGTCMLVGSDTPYALKIVRPSAGENVLDEFQKCKYFHRKGLSPKPLAYYEAPHPQFPHIRLSLVLMEALADMLPSVLGKVVVSKERMEGVAYNFLQMHAKMQKLGLCHGDLHFENIGIDKNFDMKFIDMGYASTDHTCGALDMVQLIRTLSPVFMKDVKGAYDSEIRLAKAALKAYGKKDPELRDQLRHIIKGTTDKVGNAVKNAKFLRGHLLRMAGQMYPEMFKTERMDQRQVDRLHLRLHRANN